MDWHDHVTVDHTVCHGAPCFKGTRVMVSVVLENLAEGRTTDEILEDYPSLQRESVPTALAFAAELARKGIAAPARVRCGVRFKVDENLPASISERSC